MRFGMGMGMAPVGRPGTAGVTYSAEAIALFARITSPPTDARKLLINNLIVSLKSAGIWAKLDVLQVYAAADSQAALLNWLSTSFNATAQNAPTFTADQGYAGNGTSSYLNSGFNPVTAAGQYAQDSCHIGVWSRTNAQSAGSDIGMRTSSSANQSILNARSTGDQYVLRPNVGTSPAVVGAVTDSSGHFILRRNAASGATATTVFKNGVSQTDQNSTSVSLASLNFFVCGTNTGGTPSVFSSRQYAAAHLGSSLTDQNMADFYTAMNTYMVAIGAA